MIDSFDIGYLGDLQKRYDTQYKHNLEYFNNLNCDTKINEIIKKNIYSNFYLILNNYFSEIENYLIDKYYLELSPTIRYKANDEFLELINSKAISFISYRIVVDNIIDTLKIEDKNLSYYSILNNKNIVFDYDVFNTDKYNISIITNYNFRNEKLYWNRVLNYILDRPLSCEIFKHINYELKDSNILFIFDKEEDRTKLINHFNLEDLKNLENDFNDYNTDEFFNQ